MAKVHLETGKFGAAACGKDHVDTTTDPALVTCEACERTEAFSATPAVHEHEWIARYGDTITTTNPDGATMQYPVPDGATCECGAVLTQDQWSARSPS